MKDIPQNIVLEGPRIILKSPPTSDYNEEARKFYSNSENMTYLPFFNKQWTEEDIEKRRAYQRGLQENQQAFNFDIFMKSTNEFIGIGGFRIIDKEKADGEFGIILDKSVWRQGLSTEAHLIFLTEAFENLGMKYAYAGTSPENIPMIHFFEKFGITYKETIEDNNLTWKRFGIHHGQWETVKKIFTTSLEKNGK